jgi:hypothetical protein
VILRLRRQYDRHAGKGASQFLILIGLLEEENVHNHALDAGFSQVVQGISVQRPWPVDDAPIRGQRLVIDTRHHDIGRAVLIAEEAVREPPLPGLEGLHAPHEQGDGNGHHQNEKSRHAPACFPSAAPP